MFAGLDTAQIWARPTKALARMISHLILEGRPLTTRARWLNHFLFAQFALVERLPSFKRIEKPIYIVGTGRSGTTILGQILSLHADVAFLNEPKALWHAIYSGEDLIGSYSRACAQYRLSAFDVTDDVVRKAHSLYAYSLSVTGSQRIVDKYPEMIFRIPFLQTIFPDAKFLFLVRNGMDTVRSIASWSKKARVENGGETHDWWGVDRRKWRIIVDELVPTEPLLASAKQQINQTRAQEEMAAVEWMVTMQEGLRLLKSAPDSVYKLHYEELTECPEQTLQALLDFCELPHDPVFLEYAKQTLQPNVAKEPLILPSYLDKPFRETMTALGYPSD